MSPKRLRLLVFKKKKRLWLLTTVTLQLTNIQISSYFRPRLLVARLPSLPQLEELHISDTSSYTERELLSEQGTPITLPKLKHLSF
jgi:hypothetical protein